MNTFPSGIKFKYPWRNYQARVLAELENFLDNNALHVVAPPGSGKTVLGLEVMLRINKPTLILAPTIAVRNQWIDRFCELFLQTEVIPEWISCDIRHPSFLTVSTYQGLHAACNDFKDNCRSGSCMREIVRLLREQGIQTVVVDEAHHLKNEWWTTLISLKEELKPTLVGLTATPPYDVSVNEWQRYIELNGPIDTEITVPELIIEGDLCPHQDCVCFSRPSAEEYKVIDKYRNQVYALFQEIKQDEELIRAMTSLSVWTEPNKNLDWIYSNMPYYSSLLIFLNTAGLSVSSEHLDVLGDKHPDFPVFDYQWAQVLLKFYLLKERDRFTGFEKHQEELEHRLLRHGVMEHRQITFLQNKEITSLLGTSIEKLNSIYQIVNFEYRQLGQGLRLVVLTDFIRKEFLVNAGENTLELNKLGVIPIFEKLRRTNSEHMKIGVLTGSIIILPVSACELFEACAESRGVTKLTYNPLPYDTGYIQVALTEGLKNDVVKIVTDVFQKGGIEILIGTKSLLGEGWDAPVLNSLVLASFVGSFVLSNQMRGRAIRVEKGNREKASNIWHLVCVDPTASDGGNDVEMLKRRFRSFVGISYLETGGIENGISRLGLPADFSDAEAIDAANDRAFLRASQREKLKDQWERALGNGVSLVEEIKIPRDTECRHTHELQHLYLNRTISYLLSSLASGLLMFGQEVLYGLFKIRFRRGEELQFVLVIIGLAGLFLFGREMWKAFWLYIRYRDISKDIHKIGQALALALAKAGVIKSEKVTVVSELDDDGAVLCHLEGGTRYEKSMFINALSELVSVVNSPRYLIIRKSHSLFHTAQVDYHSVPELIGRKKEWAAYLSIQWRRLVGNNELVYTRIQDGRKILLQARMKSLAAQFADKSETVSKWR